jgi:hypothetical protein
MNKSWFKDNGFLNDEGKEALASFQKALDKVMTLAEAQDMSMAEFQTLQGNMAKMVGDQFTNFFQAKREIAKKFSDMTDAQFESYLKEKYGDRWMLVSLTKEEFARVPPIPQEVLDKTAEEVRNLREAFCFGGVRIDRNLRFK